jgi:radical SAM protein with 4Fe4S-binding SPASM domain
MTLSEQLIELKVHFDVLSIIDLDPWQSLPEYEQKSWMKKIIEPIYRESYKDNQRIVFTTTHRDIYDHSGSNPGKLLTQLQRRLNEIDISNYFVVLLTNDNVMKELYQQHHTSISTDPVPFVVLLHSSDQQSKKSKYQYNYHNPLKIDIEDLSDKEKFLLTKSSSFCMYPWIHLHAYPTGQAYPCCMSDMDYPVGNMREHTLEQIWNQESMRNIRNLMLNDQPVSACTRCYEQEANGMVSGRISANKHHGHHINRIHKTQSDGTLDQFEMTYWDIRFSNLCNLSCRSCGHIFSSSWYQDQSKLAGSEWKKINKVLNYAGRFETDAWDQLVDHIDHVEQIYFAGGEPLLMEEHYRILDELVRRKKFDVRLIYNTNFTHTDLKGQSVFEYWKKFDSVSVGASLDDSDERAEYIRKGTKWHNVIENRREMLRVCPKVDFYISPTLSIMNALHLPKFHRSWVERGLIRAQDLNVNILQDPAHYRIDIAPAEYKAAIELEYRNHINWLKDQGDHLGRATQGFESAITFMNAIDNTHLIDKFWRKTNELDEIRKEKLLDFIPELIALK